MIPTKTFLSAIPLHCAIFVACVSLFETHAAPAEKPRPNIVIILADDLGAEALGCYGGREFLGERGAVLGPVKTPNLDAMAKGGMQFNKAFSTPVCSPSRAQLLTGKYNFRIGFPDILGRNGATRSLDPKAHPTLAALLKSAGYVTAAVGKWHLGDAGGEAAVPKSADAETSTSHPRECGFDRQSLFGGGHLEDYGDPGGGTYTPDILQKWTMKFLESRKGKAEPFFLYYASPLPHFPYLPTPLNPDGPGRGNDKKGQMYGSMQNFPFLVEYLDKEAGEILKKLDDLGMRENTLVIFAGDNGTPPWLVTQMKDGRKVSFGKATMKDTGSWVPCLASWPGVIAPGSVYDGLVDFSDIMPTCLQLAGVEPPTGLDGVSFAPQLEGRPGHPREWIHSLYGEKYFLRNARWKLRENGELFDMNDAPYEEKLVPPDRDTPESQAARKQLQSAMDSLHPTKNP